MSVLPATVWPIALLLACLVAESATLAIGVDDLDEVYFLQQAVRVLHGQIPFRDFESLYSPGLTYLHAALFAAFGGPSLMTPRLLALGARAATTALLYVMALPLARRPLWAAVPGLVLLLGIDDAPVRWEPHPGWLSTLFALLATWWLGHSQSSRCLIASGALAALACVFKQNTGEFMLLAILLWCGRRRFQLPLVAFSAMTLLWLVPLAIVQNGHLANLAVLVGAINEAGLFSAPEPTILIPVACVLGGFWLLRRDSDPRLRWYLLAGLAIFLTEFPRLDTLHLAWSAPLLLVLGAIALGRIPVLPALLIILVVVALLAPTWSSRLAFLRLPRAPVAGVEAPAATAADLQGVVAEIQQRSGPGEPIFAYPTSPLLYVLADRPNPTRFDHLNPGAASAAQIDQVIADLTVAEVRLVIISEFWRLAWGPPGPNVPLESWLNARYIEVARYGSYRVLAAAL